MFFDLPEKERKEIEQYCDITEEMAQTTVIAKTLGNYEPMSDEAIAAMKALIAADQAV